MRVIDLEGTVAYYAGDGKWVVSENPVKIPEGYYIVPPEKGDEE